MRRGGRHADRGLEVLMLKRGSGARFMPGVWVFAGGAVERSDRSRAGELLGDEAFDAPVPDADDAAHRVCGARELGEEAGVDLAPVALRPWSRWITPEEVPIRFDTRFYVALAPAHCNPVADGVEMDEARWVAPAAALEAAGADALELSFPTTRHLEILAPHADADAVLEAASKLTVEPVLPRIRASGEEFEVLLPGEPGYEG